MMTRIGVRVYISILLSVLGGPFVASIAQAQDTPPKCEDYTTPERCWGQEGYYGANLNRKCHWNGNNCEQGLITFKSIEKFQQVLKDYGFTNLKSTGKLDDQTVDALKKFQTQKGLTASGKLDQKTIDALRQ